MFVEGKGEEAQEEEREEGRAGGWEGAKTKRKAGGGEVYFPILI